MMDIVCIGELLTDLLPAGESENAYPLFEFNPGGAPANVAAAAARLGARVAFIGKTGDQPLDWLLIRALEKRHVDVSGIIRDPGENTSLSVVHLDARGERSFSFFGEHPADLALRPEDLREDLIRGCRMLHFGARTLLSSTGKASVEAACTLARHSGALISFDPNIRPALWKSADQARADSLWGMDHADLIKLSLEELRLVDAGGSVESVISSLNTKGKRCVVTNGREGAWVQGKEEVEHIPTYPVPSEDSTGAGDAFWGAFLYAWVYRPGMPVTDMVRMACAAGALATTKKGAMTTQPVLEEIRRLMEESSGGKVSPGG